MNFLVAACSDNYFMSATLHCDWLKKICDLLSIESYDSHGKYAFLRVSKFHQHWNGFFAGTLPCEQRQFFSCSAGYQYINSTNTKTAFFRYLDATTIEMGPGHFCRYINFTNTEMAFCRPINSTDIEMAFCRYVDSTNTKMASFTGT